MSTAHGSNGKPARGMARVAGWTYFECHNCYEVIFEGRWISQEDLAVMREAHDMACPAKLVSPTPSAPPLWKRIFRGSTP